MMMMMMLMMMIKEYALQAERVCRDYVQLDEVLDETLFRIPYRTLFLSYWGSGVGLLSQS